jgi:hypothetical protein
MKTIHLKQSGFTVFSAIPRPAQRWILWIDSIHQMTKHHWIKNPELRLIPLFQLALCSEQVLNDLKHRHPDYFIPKIASSAN